MDFSLSLALRGSLIITTLAATITLVVVALVVEMIGRPLVKVLPASLIPIAVVVVVVIAVVATASATTTTLMSSAVAESSTATTIAPSLTQLRAMIKIVAVVPAHGALVTGSTLTATTTTDIWFILVSFVLLAIPLLGLGLLGGLSIRLLLVFRLIPLDWLAVRDANTLFLLPVITALHEPCNSCYSLGEIRWVLTDILKLVTIISRVHAIHDRLPLNFSWDTGGFWDSFQHFINITSSCQNIFRIFVRDVAFDVFQQNTANVLLIAREITYDFVYETLAILISVIVSITKKLLSS